MRGSDKKNKFIYTIPQSIHTLTMGVRQYRVEFTMVDERNAREIGKFFELARRWLDEAEKMALRTGVIPGVIRLMRTTFSITPKKTTKEQTDISSSH